jgi:predicted transposase/invertase (TIGR01784 family)
MKTDTIFYTLLQNLPSVLFELLEQPPILASRYEFSSVEVKELARRIDGVFLPKPDFPGEPIYFVEVQFQPDEDLYWRLVTEAAVYLNQYKPHRTCQGVVLWAKRSFDPGIPLVYQSLFDVGYIRIIYLDELDEGSGSSIGLGIIKLVVTPEDEAIQQARSLINQVQQADAANRRNLLELVERILVYKFSSYSRQELEAMFGLSEWKQTRFYQEVREETRQELKEEVKEEIKEETQLENIPALLKLGLSVEQISEALKLEIEVVRQVANNQNQNQK